MTVNFIAVNYYSSSDAPFASSEDGITWVGLNPTGTITRGFGVASSGSRWLLSALDSEDGYVLLVSSDGVNWDRIADAPNRTFRKAETDGTMIVAVGSGFPGTGDAAGYSYNGVTWTAVNGIPATYANEVAYNDGMWVIVSAASATGFKVWYSANGIDYTQATGPYTEGYAQYQYGVAYGADKFVVGGLTYTGPESELYYSANGITWTAEGDFWGTPSTELRVDAIAYGNGRWVLGTSNYSGWLDSALWYSADGLSWTACTTPTDFTSYCRDITWSESLGRWVAVGQSGEESILYSSDGISWTPASNNPMYEDETCQAIYIESLRSDGPIPGPVIRRIFVGDVAFEVS